MLKNMKIIGLCLIMLMATPQAHSKTCVWNTFWKTFSAIPIGIPFGVLRSAAHIATHKLSKHIWGGTESLFLRKPLAIAAGAALWISLNSILEVSRTNIAEKIEQNLDDERENIHLTNTLARYIDWMIALMGVAACEYYNGDTDKVFSTAQLWLTPSDMARSR